jgi:hypothetical protein
VRIVHEAVSRVWPAQKWKLHVTICHLNDGSFLDRKVQRHQYLAVLLVVSILIGNYCYAAPPGRWLEPAPASIGPSNKWMAISANAFFEVPASKLAAAESWLSERPILSQEGASFFGRPDFKCASFSKLYLVRAFYVNGGTGRFGLYWAGSALVVSHESLGPARDPSQSALVVCLARKPTAIYSLISGAL